MPSQVVGPRTLRLTEQQEAFAQDVARGVAKATAYRRHYGVSDKVSPQKVAERAHGLAGRVQVHKRIVELRQQFRAEADKTFVFGQVEWFRQNLRLALADPRALFHADGRPKKPHELDDDIAQAVSGVEIGPTGSIKYKLTSKAPIMDQLGRQLGVFEADNRQKGLATLQEFLQMVGAAGRIMPVVLEHDERSHEKPEPAPTGAIVVRDEP